MNQQYQLGQVVGYFGNPVIIQSAQKRSDGGLMYLVESADGSFFRARHENLKPQRPIMKEIRDQALSFEVACSRSANLRR